MGRYKTSSFVSIAASTLLLLLLLNDYYVIVFAGWPKAMSKKDKQKMNDIMSGRLELPTDLELFVKYKNRKGKKLAKRLAVNGKFDMSVSKRNVLALKCQNRTALKKMVRNKNVEYVEPVHRVHALPVWGAKDSQEEEAHDHTQRRLEESIGYGINMVQAPELWDLPPGANMTICVIDSGYALGHPDLPTLEDGVTGSPSKKGDDWSVDSYGHGTHCAGILGAIGGNNEGVVGVMKDPSRFKFHITKALDGQGLGTEMEVLDAIEKCVDAGSNIISMSLGSDEGQNSATIEDTIREAYDDGILFIGAAGNDGTSDKMFPASYSTVLSVAAVNQDMKVASFSQKNNQVEIAGPGVDILSTTTSNNGRDYIYDEWSGTSMATPYVAGVAALVWSQFPECSNNQIRNVLIRTAKLNNDYAGYSEALGFGVVQAKAAYDLLLSDGCNAGDESPNPLSAGAVGGRAQDSSYVIPPTSAPTVFTCNEKVFELILKTDDWADETSWELTNSTGDTLGSGSDFLKSTTYEEKICLDSDDSFTFTIHDSNGDGLCCRYGLGSYSMYFDGELIKTGGNFSSVELVTFGDTANLQPTVAPEVTSPPTPMPNLVCQDDPKWVHVNKKGFKKKCPWILNGNKELRCQLMGIGSDNKEVPGFIGCPDTCGSCGPNVSLEQPSSNDTVSLAPTPAPTNTPTTDPTQTPTAPPTAAPTQEPSSPPTLAPTPNPIPPPTSEPTDSPSAKPSRAPTKEPTSNPTDQPTVPPTPEPTILLTRPPTLSPTEPPTMAPTPPPSPLPTLEPTSDPTASPTKSPTMEPTPRPSPPPTPEPTLNPTPNPTEEPTKFPTPEPTVARTAPPTPPPTGPPTLPPTPNPTPYPSKAPSPLPTNPPTAQPTPAPTLLPTPRPSVPPTNTPTPNPTGSPTPQPSWSPTRRPTRPPSPPPTNLPTHFPTPQPTPLPTNKPSLTPTRLPTVAPTEDEDVFEAKNLDCRDDDKWVYSPLWGSSKSCLYVETRPSSRCDLWGEIAGQEDRVQAREACPVACGTCDESQSNPSTPKPTPTPTPSGSKCCSFDGNSCTDNSYCHYSKDRCEDTCVGKWINGDPESAPRPPAPSPTQPPPTRQPQAPSQPSSGMCCSDDHRNCRSHEDPFCDANKSNCENNCSGHYIDPVKAQQETCIALWGECTHNKSGCCGSDTYCKSQGGDYRQCVPEGQ